MEQKQDSIDLMRQFADLVVMKLKPLVEKVSSGIYSGVVEFTLEDGGQRISMRYPENHIVASEGFIDELATLASRDMFCELENFKLEAK